MEINDEVSSIGRLNQKFLWRADQPSQYLRGHYLSGIVFAIMALDMNDILLRDPSGLFYSKDLLYDRVTNGGMLLSIVEGNASMTGSPDRCANQKFVEFGRYAIQYQDDKFVDGIRFFCTLIGYAHCNIKIF